MLATPNVSFAMLRRVSHYDTNNGRHYQHCHVGDFNTQSLTLNQLQKITLGVASIKSDHSGCAILSLPQSPLLCLLFLDSCM